MDKNTITGFILIALVVIGFSWYSQPSREELEAMAQRDSIAAVEQQKQAEAEQGAGGGNDGLPAPAAPGGEQHKGSQPHHPENAYADDLDVGAKRTGQRKERSPEQGGLLPQAHAGQHYQQRKGQQRRPDIPLH